MKTVFKYFFLFVFLMQPAQAEDTLMVRLDLGFEETMIRMKDVVEEFGYKIVHIQKCDEGLSEFGYKTDAYKVIFFSKLNEIRNIVDNYPHLAPFVPLKIAVIKENDDIILVSLNPSTLAQFFTTRDIQLQLSRWENDIRAMMQDMLESDEKTLKVFDEQ